MVKDPSKKPNTPPVQTTNNNNNNADQQQNAIQAGLAMKFLGSQMIIQLFAKISHFALGLLIVRFLSPEHYGASALQLPFVAMGITRLFKEAFHRSAIRAEGKSKMQHLAIVWLSIPATIILSSCIGVFFSSSQDFITYPWMFRGFLCWLVSAWIEMAVEPIIIYVESHLITNVSVSVESSAIALQSVVMIVMLYMFSENTEILVLIQSYGQLVYSLALVAGYYMYAWKSGVLRKIWPSSFNVDRNTLNEAAGFLVQSVSKYVTAEGEHAILFFYGSAQQQGLYEFVANLGSIVARVAFQSIEKTGFSIFPRLASNREERLKSWKMLLNVSFMISLLYLSVCPVYIQFLVNLIYGPKWSETSAPQLLILFGFYLLLIGVNGLVEALRDAVTPYSILQKQTTFIIFSVVTYFAAGSILMNYYGAGGLIIASCLSTIMRTAYNVNTFKQYLFPVSEGIPATNVLVVYASILASGLAARAVLGDSWKLFGFGVVQGALFLGWMVFFQYKELANTYKLIKRE